MRLDSVRVDRYGPLSGLEHEFDGGLEVCYGPNESGKTLLLDAILRLCSPDAVDAVPDVGRVEADPVGHAVLVTGSDRGDDRSPADAAQREAATNPTGPTTPTTTEHVLGDGTTLGDVTGVTPRQLRNVFVVRDADLRLTEEHEFYDATARRLGDLHTAQIGALRERIVDRGRLTPTALDLSGAAEHGGAADVRDDAAALAGRLREYVADCRESGIEAAERERIAVAADLEDLRGDLERQRAARTLATHDRLSEHLATVREATESLDGTDCTPAGLDRLETIEAEVERLGDQLSDLRERRESLREERNDLADQRAALEADLAPLEERAPSIEDVEGALDGLRDVAPEATAGGSGGQTEPGDSRIRFGVGIAIAAALGAGASAVAGSATAAVVLAVLAAIATAWAGQGIRLRRRARRERAEVQTAARDAGLAVESIAEVAPAIERHREERTRLAERRDEVTAEIEVRDRRLEDLEERRRETLASRRELERERRELLQRAGVPDLAAYREAVEAADTLRTERREAIASLAERLGDRPDASMDERLEHWAGELDALQVSVGDGDVTADVYDADELERLAEAVEACEGRLASLEDRLEEHEDEVNRFAEEVATLPTGRFREDPIALAARSVEGLAATARELADLVDDLERDADVSRVAIAALEEVRAAEEQKLASLFGPESTASDTFRSITGGRYEAVTYDADDRTLAVHRADGRRSTPRALSRGASDQLYLAARIGLAEELLRGEPGFLLLDDPLLPADRERLTAGFDALRRLAVEGWQIVYFTAKPEVGEELVERHELPCRRFERLS